MTLIDENYIPETGALFNFGEIGGEELETKLWIKNDKIISLSCGDEFCVLITRSGRAFGYGKNDWGQLGLNDIKTTLTPSCIKALKNLNEKAILVACGRCHTIIWTESKKLYGFGCNNDGQLGLDDKISSTSEPKEITSWIYGNICQLKAGGEFSAAINETGKLYVWGSNSEYQLGLGDHSDEVIYKPTLLSFFKSPVSYVDCGNYHAAAISQGRLYVWGEYTNQKLGDSFQENQSTPQGILIKIPIKQVSCGHNHTVCLSENGDVYVWGKGDSGQLGLGPHYLSSEFPKLLRIPNLLVKGSGDSLESTEKFINISAGESHTVITTTKGLALSFGDGRHGKLGNIGGARNYSNYMLPKLIANLDKDLWVYNVQCGGCHTVVLVRNRESHELINEIISEYALATIESDTFSVLSENTEFNSSSLRARRNRREHLKTEDGDLPTLIQLNPIFNGIPENNTRKKKKDNPKTNGDIEERIDVMQTGTLQSAPTEATLNTIDQYDKAQESSDKNSISTVYSNVSPNKKNLTDESEIKPIDTKTEATNPEVAHVGCAANCKRNQKSDPKKTSTEMPQEKDQCSTTSIISENNKSKQESKTCSLL